MLAKVEDDVSVDHCIKAVFQAVHAGIVNHNFTLRPHADDVQKWSGVESIHSYGRMIAITNEDGSRELGLLGRSGNVGCFARAAVDGAVTPCGKMNVAGVSEFLDVYQARLKL